MNPRPKKALIVIAAIAVMLVGATSAYGYYEAWDGWFNSGHLNYNSKRYTIVESALQCDDSTYISLTRDTFYLTIDALTFVCAAGYNDSIFVCIPTFTGGKDTDTTGTKEGSGVWSGTAILRRSGLPPDTFTIWGTWASTGNHFNYNTRPPTYTASWLVTGSNPPGVVTGGGTCSGTRSSYLPD